MQCSMSIRASGNKMKTNSYRNPYKKDSFLDRNVDQLCTKLQNIKDKQDSSRVGMPTITLEHSEAVRRYYAAFPALKKGQESPLQYYQPPSWCRKPAIDNKMQSESLPKDWSRNKKLCKAGKERRNSGQKKTKKRCNSFAREGERLPEWVTDEAEWDMDSQDPVKEFIRAIALDEGYGTGENADDGRVPDWGHWMLDEQLRPRTPLEDELYAKFEAKFDRSIEALWAKEPTPDDEYQDLPIDFTELLSSPSDKMFAAPLEDTVWSDTSSAARLADSLKPLHLADKPAQPPELESFALYEGDEIYDALSTVASTMRSFTALNHSRERSGFVEVPPRRAGGTHTVPSSVKAPRREPEREREREDLLTSARTHFRPIRKEPETRYKDGDTFDIRGSLDAVEMRRSDSGGLYFGSERYLEYRASHSVDYTRLRLTAAQQCPEFDDPAFRLRFPLRQTNAAVQTDPSPPIPESSTASKKLRAGAAGEFAWVAPPPPDEWEELLSDISAAHAEYLRAEVEETLVSAERKRRHSAALRPGAPCSHPHARFLHCCVLGPDRPLTR